MNDHLQHVAYKLINSPRSDMQRHIPGSSHVHTYTHINTCTNITIHKFIPRDSLHLCQRSILPALISYVSHTLSMQTSFESICSSVLSLFLSVCVHRLLSSSPLLCPSLLELWRIWLKTPVSRLQTVHIVLSLTLSAVGRFKETREKGVWACVCVCVCFGGG